MRNQHSGSKQKGGDFGDELETIFDNEKNIENVVKNIIAFDAETVNGSIPTKASFGDTTSKKNEVPDSVTNNMVTSVAFFRTIERVNNLHFQHYSDLLYGINKFLNNLNTPSLSDIGAPGKFSMFNNVGAAALYGPYLMEKLSANNDINRLYLVSVVTLVQKILGIEEDDTSVTLLQRVQQFTKYIDDLAGEIHNKINIDTATAKTNLLSALNIAVNTIYTIPPPSSIASLPTYTDLAPIDAGKFKIMMNSAVQMNGTTVLDYSTVLPYFKTIYDGLNSLTDDDEKKKVKRYIYNYNFLVYPTHGTTTAGTLATAITTDYPKLTVDDALPTLPTTTSFGDHLKNIYELIELNKSQNVTLGALLQYVVGDVDKSEINNPEAITGTEYPKLVAIHKDLAQKIKFAEVIIDYVKTNKSDFTKKINNIIANTMVPNIAETKEYLKASDDFVSYTPSNIKNDPAKKLTLENVLMWKVYGVVSKNKAFFNKYFVLLNNNNPQQYDAAKSVSSSNRKYWRLNVKKVTGAESSLTIFSNKIYNDIVYLDNVKQLENPGQNIMNVCIDPNNCVNDVSVAGLYNMLRTLYFQDTDVRTVNLKNSQIDIERAVRFGVGRTMNFYLSPDFTIDNILKNYGDKPSSSIGVSMEWIENEHRVTTELLRSKNRWMRKENTFVLYDENGKQVAVKDDDNCALINRRGDECRALVYSCVNGNCEDLLNVDFNFTSNVNHTMKEVQKMNPMVALTILDKYCFGFLYKEVRFSPNYKRKVVQTLDEWLNELQMTPAPVRCAAEPSTGKVVQGTPGCGTLADQLGPVKLNAIKTMMNDPTKKSFFTYLEILSNWVNANPTVLNKYENENANTNLKHAKNDPSFNLYNSARPYSKSVGTRGVQCGLREIAESQLSEGNGYGIGNTVRTISNIIGSAPINLGLTRNAPIGPSSRAFVFQRGGDDYENINALLYQNFTPVFHTMRDTYQIYTGRMIQAGMELSNNTKSKFSTAMKELRQRELDIIEDYKKLIKVQKIQESLGNKVRLDEMSDAERKLFLETQYNVGNTGARYNETITGVLAMFRAMERALNENNGGRQVNLTLDDAFRNTVPTYRGKN
jgi:hypothetical protein